jgi:nicotinate-nucleotide adenylyltransferase
VAPDHLRSLGVLGGTFNPPHLGHLALARHARDELGLERVVLMPAHTSPHKASAQDPGPQHRLGMCRLLVADAGGLSVCELEIGRGGSSYTVDSLTLIHASHPDAELTLIVGADTASTLPSWREPSKLLELAALAVAPRAGVDRQPLLDSVTPLAGARAIRFLTAPLVEVSSSMARERVARGGEIDDLVGPAVASYITEHGLYRSPAESAS